MNFNSNLFITDRLYDYILQVSLREPPILKKLRLEELKADEINFQSSPEQAQLITFLAKTINARKLLEVGVFKGYTTLSLALGLPDETKIFACDVSEEWLNIAKSYWVKAGVENKIVLNIAPALQTLNQLIYEGHANSFDFAFIDADKENYNAYYEAILSLIRPGGLILIDNTLWYGKVADLSINDEKTTAIRDLNTKLYQDEQIDISMLAIRDGLTIIRKR